MQNPNSLLSRASDLGAFLLNRSADIEIFGMFGAGNLGDEAMWVAASRYFPAHRTVKCRPATRIRHLERAIKKGTRRHIVVGGGTLIHGGSTGWLDYVEHRVATGAQLSCFGTGIAFLPEQMTTSYPPFQRWATLLRGARVLKFRGPLSLNVARNMGADGTIFGDMALSLAQHTAVPTKGESGRIGLNFGLCLGDQTLFERSAAEVVRRLKHDFEIRFYAVVSSDIEPTLRIAEAAGLKGDKICLESIFWSPDEFMKSVSSVDGFIGLKLHAAGLAHISGIPSIMIRYLPKCDDFAAPIHSEHILVDLPLNVEEVVEKLEHAIKFTENWINAPRVQELAEMQRYAMSQFIE